VVIMGGSIYRGYNDLGYTPERGPEPEYNIVSDIRRRGGVCSLPALLCL